jgi:mono/diheme cytochrome c family protein
MRFVTGFAFGLIVSVAVPLLALRLGLVDMSATPEPGSIETFVGNLAYESWIERVAPRRQDPFDANPAAVAVGLDHYRENCVGCHGAPGVEAGELPKGLHPSAPELWKGSEEMSDGELFWTIREGVRMTGMPAFAPTHSDEEIWKIVAFLRHLPHLTAEEKAELRSGAEEQDHHLQHHEASSD